MVNTSRTKYLCQISQPRENILLAGAKGQHRCHLIASMYAPCPATARSSSAILVGKLDVLQVAHTRRGCESAKLIDARLCVLPSRSRGWRLRGTQARTSAQQSDLDVEKLFMTLGNVGGFDHHPGNFEPDISRQVKIVRIGRIHAYPV